MKLKPRGGRSRSRSRKPSKSKRSKSKRPKSKRPKSKRSKSKSRESKSKSKRSKKKESKKKESKKKKKEESKKKKKEESKKKKKEESKKKKKEEEAPAEEAPAEEAPPEKAPAEEAPPEKAPAEEAPPEKAPAEEAPPEKAPAEEAPPEKAPAEEAPPEKTPAEEAPPEKAPKPKPSLFSALSFTQSESDTSSKLEFPYPDNLTPEELGIDITQGPDFESFHNPNRASSGKLMELPKSIEKELDRYLNERIISPEMEKKYKLPMFTKQLNKLYRESSKLYFTIDYVVNYNSETAIRTNMEDVPPEGKELIEEFSLLLLIFADPSFLSLIFVFFLLQTILEYTILPNDQKFNYSDIPLSPWYIPVFITRTIGNIFFFIFYFLIILWAGIRRLVNKDSSIPGTLLYITSILICIQVIFILYINATSGELPLHALKDSITTVLSYMVPLVIFSYFPNIIQIIPSDSVRVHSQVPIIPVDPAQNTRYTFDLNVLKCYTSGTFYQNVALYTVLYAIFTYAFYPLDPTLSKFIREDLKKLKDRDDVPTPVAINQSMISKVIFACLYHLAIIFTISISSLSIMGMPSPHNSAKFAFYHMVLFAILLPLGKFLIELKYRSNELDFYGPFYDFFFTIVRIIAPMYILGYLQPFMQVLSFLMFFDTTKPLPTWMVATIAGLILLTFVLIVRWFHPAPEEEEENEPESFVSPDKDFIEEENAEKSIHTLLHKAKDLLHFVQKRD